MVNSSLINNSGKNILFNRAFGDASQSKPTIARFGRVQSDVLITDTSLDNEITINNTESIDDAEATTGWSTDADNVIALDSSTYKEGSNSLDIRKTGTSLSTSTTAKTVTSVDFTDKYVHTWLYINTTNVALATTGTAVELRFGSGASDYYSKTYTKSEYTALQVGNWADLYFDDSETATGSPVVTACDYFAIILTLTATSDVWVVGSVLFDDIRVSEDADYKVSLDSGYPTNDTTNREQTRQYTLAASDSVGYNIDSLFEENTDGTVLSYGLSKFPDESKSSTDRFIMIIVDRLM